MTRITEKRYNGFMKSEFSVKKGRNKHGKERFGASITSLLDSEGKVIVTK